MMKCHGHSTGERYLKKHVIKLSEGSLPSQQNHVLLSTYQASKICFAKVRIFIVIKYVASLYAPSFTNYEVRNDKYLIIADNTIPLDS
jgi:hypothetical protein